ncbi:hypothetical protein BSF44_56900 [Pseudomonas sp. ACN8]|jgi:hypothetical protein|nr:hypothetical protein [Pseudomonas sp. ACN8]PBJ16999.1 hypothetical protein BSF44_56900 [Pseudomonas sp. ACN8]
MAKIPSDMDPTGTNLPINEKTSEQVPLHAKQLLDYRIKAAQRGTPHFN